MQCCRPKKPGSERSYLNILGFHKRQDSQIEQKKLDLHNQLLEYVKTNDTDNIKQLIHSHNELLTVKYAHPYFKSIIPIARFNLHRQTHPKTLETLIDLGFHINNSLNRYDELLYFSAAGCHVNRLREVLGWFREKCPESLNDTREGDTCLMFLIKYGRASDVNFGYCARVIVDANVDVNIPDYNNCSPIVRAAYLYNNFSKKINATSEQQAVLDNFGELIKIILSKGNVDIDSHKWYEKTAREYLLENNIFNVSKIGRHRNNKHKDVRSHLFSLVIEKNEKKFTNLKRVKSYNVNDGENTLLQLACLLKLETIVRFLLKKGANPNLTTKRNQETPLEMSAKRNHYKIFEILLNDPETIITQEIYNNFALNRGNKIKEKYFLCLLQSSKVDVDYVCKNGNTPLHYAAMFSENQSVMDIIKRGGSLVVENKFKERPIDYIDPRVLRKYADECVESKPGQNVYHKKSVITFDYEFLLKTQRKDFDDSLLDIEDLGPLHKDRYDFSSETEVALTISEFPEMRNLLKHPVISSFLYVKWYKIKVCFWLIMLFHSICYLSFLNYFLNSSRYGNLEMGLSFWIFLFTYIAYTFFIVTRIVVIRDDLNMYFHCYLECSLIVIILIISSLPNKEIRKHLSVFGIIISAFSFIFWAGYHPKMSSHVAMLQRVSYNFFKILLCYLVLILAFGVGFHILFRDEDLQITTTTNTTETMKNDFFQNPLTSIFKTFVMMSGEFETTEIHFKETNFSSYIIFLLFVFIITIILTNLLQGVAVTDTETIQNVSEIVGHIATIRFIRFIEMILQISCIPKVIYHSRINVENWFLIPNSLSDFKLSFFPNMRGKVKCEPRSAMSDLRMSRKIVKDAMNVILKREAKYNKLGMEGLTGMEELREMQARIEEIAEKQKIFNKKFQESIDTLACSMKMITDNFEIVAENE